MEKSFYLVNYTQKNSRHWNQTKKSIYPFLICFHFVWTRFNFGVSILTYEPGNKNFLTLNLVIVRLIQKECVLIELPSDRANVVFLGANILRWYEHTITKKFKRNRHNETQSKSSQSNITKTEITPLRTSRTDRKKEWAGRECYVQFYFQILYALYMQCTEHLIWLLIRFCPNQIGNIGKLRATNLCIWRIIFGRYTVIW